jgi:hypothetical protein
MHVEGLAEDHELGSAADLGHTLHGRTSHLREGVGEDLPPHAASLDQGVIDVPENEPVRGHRTCPSD